MKFCTLLFLSDNGGGHSAPGEGEHASRSRHRSDADRSETNSLASQHPDIVKTLTAKWDKIAKDTHVYPLDGRVWGTKIKDPLGNRSEIKR
jgi:hypothetical protein